MKLNIKKIKIGSSIYDVAYVANLQDEKGTDLAGKLTGELQYAQMETIRTNFRLYFTKIFTVSVGNME